MIDKIKSYFWMALSILLGGLLAVQTLRMHGAQLAKAEAVVATATDRATASSKLAIGQEKARVTEYTLNTGAAGITKATNVAVQTLSTQRDSLLQRVRIAESNVATARLVSQATAASSTGRTVSRSDGPELLGTLGEADVGEAHRGDTIRLHLAACYAKYGEVRKALAAQ